MPRPLSVPSGPKGRARPEDVAIGARQNGSCSTCRPRSNDTHQHCAPRAPTVADAKVHQEKAKAKDEFHRVLRGRESEAEIERSCLGASARHCKLRRNAASARRSSAPAARARATPGPGATPVADVDTDGVCARLPRRRTAPRAAETTLIATASWVALGDEAMGAPRTEWSPGRLEKGSPRAARWRRTRPRRRLQEGRTERIAGHLSRSKGEASAIKKKRRRRRRDGDGLGADGEGDDSSFSSTSSSSLACDGRG